MDIPLDIQDENSKIKMCVKNIHLEGTVSQLSCIEQDIFGENNYVQS